MPEGLLTVQWLRLRDSSAKDVGLIPGQGAKISRVAQHSQKIGGKKKKITPGASLQRTPCVSSRVWPWLLAFVKSSPEDSNVQLSLRSTEAAHEGQLYDVRAWN